MVSTPLDLTQPIEPAPDLPTALAAVRRTIADSAGEIGRRPDSVTLIAVSKTQPTTALTAAISAGQRVFGENRVQEAKTKWPELRSQHPDLELHLIGPLQTNKVREAIALFDVIETVDRPRLAEALATEAQRAGRCPRLLVEVNTGDEAQKAGVSPLELEPFLELCRERHGLPIAGLMCIPPQTEDPSLHFALLANLGRRFGLEILSMGMSADYPLAIRYGATHVRIGSAIFGHRQ